MLSSPEDFTFRRGIKERKRKLNFKLAQAQRSDTMKAMIQYFCYALVES
jgi:hypothetical protein